MKTFTLVTLTAMTLMLSGCKDESVDFGGNGDGGDPQTETGYLVMSAMSVTVADDAEVIPYSNGTKAAMTPLDCRTSRSIRTCQRRAGPVHLDY